MYVVHADVLAVASRARSFSRMASAVFQTAMLRWCPPSTYIMLFRWQFIREENRGFGGKNGTVFTTITIKDVTPKPED